MELNPLEGLPAYYYGRVVLNYIIIAMSTVLIIIGSTRGYGEVWPIRGLLSMEFRNSKRRS